MIPAASNASGVKLGRRPKVTARPHRETIKRRNAGAPVREIARLPLMEPVTCATAYDPADPGNEHCVQYANVFYSR
jgi:hypothetical protein